MTRYLLIIHWSSYPGLATPRSRESTVLSRLWITYLLLPCSNPIYLKRVEFGCGAPKLPSLVPPLYSRDSVQSVCIGEVDRRRRKKKKTHIRRRTLSVERNFIRRHEWFIPILFPPFSCSLAHPGDFNHACSCVSCPFSFLIFFF